MKNCKNKKFSKITLVSNLAILGIILLVFNICFGINTQVVSGKSFDAIYHGDTSKNNASIMINVYWGTEYLEPILEILEKNNIKTTFFVGGYWVSSNTVLLQKIIDSGHEIGNHGYFHKDQDKLTLTQNIEEIKKCSDLVKATTNYEISLFAPPSGAVNENVLSAAQSLNMQTIMWTKDTIDWRDHNTELIVKRATKNIQNGDLILAHPTQNTVLALQTIIDAYALAGVNLTTVSNCL